MAVKYIIERNKFTVRLFQHPASFSLEPEIWSQCEAAELDEQQAAEISDYVEQHQLGRRVAYDMWKLKDSQSMTLFMLHYG